jgi:hypothetical protein
MTVIVGAVSLYAVYRGDANPWVAFAIFELALGVIFLQELREMFGALLRKRRET